MGGRKGRSAINSKSPQLHDRVRSATRVFHFLCRLLFSSRRTERGCPRASGGPPSSHAGGVDAPHIYRPPHDTCVCVCVCAWGRREPRGRRRERERERERERGGGNVDGVELSAHFLANFFTGGSAPGRAVVVCVRRRFLMSSSSCLLIETTLVWSAMTERRARKDASWR
jgi:hypothetical protein